MIFPWKFVRICECKELQEKQSFVINLTTREKGPHISLKNNNNNNNKKKKKQKKTKKTNKKNKNNNNNNKKKNNNNNHTEAYGPQWLT